MPHIKLKENSLPGIIGLVDFRPDMGKYLYQMAQGILHGPSPIPSAFRELIATYVSNKNECEFCTKSHAATARILLGEDAHWVDEVIKDLFESSVNRKTRAMLNLAGQVAISGKHVRASDINWAKQEGMDDIEIHDTVLIAAAFCMYNRYVEGLGSSLPENDSFYEERAQLMAKGYNRVGSGEAVA